MMPGKESACSPMAPIERVSSTMARPMSSRSPSSPGGKSISSSARAWSAPLAGALGVAPQPIHAPGGVGRGPVDHGERADHQRARRAFRVEDPRRAGAHQSHVGIAARMQAGRRHVEAEFVGQILPPGSRQQQRSLHLLGVGQLERGPVFRDRDPAVVVAIQREPRVEPHAAPDRGLAIGRAVVVEVEHVRRLEERRGREHHAVVEARAGQAEHRLAVHGVLARMAQPAGHADVARGLAGFEVECVAQAGEAGARRGVAEGARGFVGIRRPGRRPRGCRGCRP